MHCEILHFLNEYFFGIYIIFFDVEGWFFFYGGLIH